MQACPHNVQVLDDFMSNPALVAVTPNKMAGYEKKRNGTYVIPDALTPSWKITRDAKTGEPRAYKGAVRRRQATFGSKYDFGQVNTVIEDRAKWPTLVTQCLEYAQKMAEEKGIDSELYNGVHVNLYESGRAGVGHHSDSEPAMLAGLPIFSFTFLNGDRQPRPFSIYHAPKKKGDKLVKVADIILEDGDLLIMQGNMQRFFKHGVEIKNGKQFDRARRLNLTVRAFKPVENRK